MDTNAVISIKGTHSYDDLPGDTVEIITSGTYAKKGDEIVITYDESEPENDGGITTTTVTINPAKKITVVRTGDVHSQLTFELGRKHLVYYDTNFGSLTVGVSTTRISSTLTDGGGDLEIDYAIEIDHTLAAENQFRLNVRPPARKNPLTLN